MAQRPFREHIRQETVKQWLRKKNLAMLVFLGLYVVAWYLGHLSPVAKIVPPLVFDILQGLPAVFIVLFIASITLRIISPRISMFFRDELEVEQRIFLAKMFEILVYSVAVGIILYNFGVTASSLVILLGFISGGLAFAVREPVLSFIIWMMVLSKKPFRIGETVSVGAIEGKVERIGTLYLTVRNPQGTLVRIPNKQLIELPITNFGTGIVSLTSRIQLRHPPKDIAVFLKKLSAQASKAIGSPVSIAFEVERQYANDKITLAFSWKGEVESRITMVHTLHALCLTKHRKCFTE